MVTQVSLCQCTQPEVGKKQDICSFVNLEIEELIAICVSFSRRCKNELHVVAMPYLSMIAIPRSIGRMIV
jgi:hypothetical protein